MNLDQIISKTIKFCHQNLLNNKDGLSYLVENRKLNINSINNFEIGLFPQNTNKLFEIINPKILREAGIIKNASKSPFKFWDTLIPVRDVYGNYIAISARTRAEKEGFSKYFNSIYKKSQHLFGLNFAKQEILNKNIAYVVEGPFDVISSHQNGLLNVVGVCGKYLSMRQISLLSRYTDKIVLILDNEVEAQLCAQKIIEKRQYNGISIVARNPFPESIKDMDEYFKNYSYQQVISSLEEKGDYDIKTLW